MTDANREMWNRRAALGLTAGSQDLIAAELERRAINRHVKDGQRVLDAGCGNGTAALWLARQHKIEIFGIDYAEEMIRAAGEAKRTEPPEHSTVYFSQADVLTAEWGRAFDLAFSQRLIINLPDWSTQRAAIERILGWLKPGGLYLMVECVQSALDRINDLRSTVGLPAIQRPWHNRYLDLNEIDDLHHDLSGRGIARWINTDNYAGHYYLLSRVLNAALAQRAGTEPAYDAPINQLALELPPTITGLWGQGVMFVWKRSGEVAP